MMGGGAILFLIFTIVVFAKGNKRNGTKNPLEILDSLLRGYDRRSIPTNNLDIATNVSCQLYIASLGSISTENMDYTTDTYLRQKWKDPRLSHAMITEPLELGDPNLVKAIWKPEIFFPNAKEANFQFVTMPNVLIRIHPDGEILYILRLALKFSCMMELSRYPLDRQVCTMQMSSFSKTTRELVLLWDLADVPVSVAKDLRMPQFQLEKVTAKQCAENKIHMGNYSCLVAQFHLKRSISFYLIQNYIPSILIVACSWVTFWMDIESVPGRISLGVITLLAVCSQTAGKFGSGVPQTSYIKAIDVWMGTCTAFVFAALIEFTFVNYMWRTRGKLTGIPTGLETQEHLFVNSNANSNANSKLVNLEMGSPSIETRLARRCAQTVRWRSFANSVDELSRILFPFGFCLFNVFYWIYYLALEDDPKYIDADAEYSKNHMDP